MMGQRSLALIALVILGFSVSSTVSQGLTESVSVSLPPIALTGVPFDAAVEGLPEGKQCTLQVFVGSEKVVQQNVFADDKGRCRFEGLVVKRTGVVTLSSVSDGQVLSQKELKAIPAWLGLLPPILAIGLSLLTRQVLLALFVGIWFGASLFVSIHSSVSFAPLTVTSLVL